MNYFGEDLMDFVTCDEKNAWLIIGPARIIPICLTDHLEFDVPTKKEVNCCFLIYVNRGMIYMLYALLYFQH